MLKAMYVEYKEVFKKNLKKQPVEEWKSYMTIKDSKKMEEEYATVGNLKPAHDKEEGAPIQYGEITDGHITTVKNKTVANGLKVSMEAKEDEQWGLVDAYKVEELTRTMITKREVDCAAIWDNVTTAVGADGVAFASNSHPLLNNGALVNDNLKTGALSNDSTGFTNWDGAIQMFNDWKNHYGDKFYTKPSAALMNISRQTSVLALLNSNLKPFESSNTKNTIPQLKLIFSSYIKLLPVHFIDETIDSAIFQRRKGITTGYTYDEKDTLDFFFNVHERYKAAMINPGFGFVTLTGE